MANTGSIVRKNLRNLNDSMELRELNRQLDWMWKKILGGLTSKDFSDGGMRSVVKTVEKTIAEDITADEVTTNVLKAALAEMMVAVIGVAKINYAQIVDLFADRVFTDSGIAGHYVMEKLQVKQAQIVDLMVSSFRMVDKEGHVHKITIDKDGNLHTERVADQDEMFANGKIPDGYSAVASELTVGNVSAGNLYVAGAADIMKLTAKYLIADRGWITDLASNTALIENLTVSGSSFINKLLTSKIIGDSTLEVLLEKADKLLRLDAEGLHIGEADWDSEVLITPSGVQVIKGDEAMAEFSESFVRLRDMIIQRTSDGLAIFAYSE